MKGAGEGAGGWGPGGSKMGTSNKKPQHKTKVRSINS